MPNVSSDNGFGYMLLHNTRPDADGRFFVTRWIVAVLPLVPLARYHVSGGVPIEISPEVTRTTTATYYRFHGRSPLRWAEVLRTYLLFWVAVPVLLFGPIIAGVLLDDDPSGDTSLMIGMGVAVVSLCLSFAVFWLYRSRWRPVREACAASDSGRG